MHTHTVTALRTAKGRLAGSLPRSRQHRTYRDNYPTGRKHCSDCGRWRHLLDFAVRQWEDEPICTVARTLTSYCLYCGAAKQRKRYSNTSKPRVWYPHGNPGSAPYKKHRNALNRASRKRRMSDPAYREMVNEYHRIWSLGHSGGKARGTKVHSEKRRTIVDATLFFKWFDVAVKEMELSQAEVFHRSGIDGAIVRRARRSQKIELHAVDAIATVLHRPDAIHTLIEEKP